MALSELLDRTKDCRSSNKHLVWKILTPHVSQTGIALANFWQAYICRFVTSVSSEKSTLIQNEPNGLYICCWIGMTYHACVQNVLVFFWQKTTWWKLNPGVEIISMNISYNNQSIITIFSEHSVCLWWFKLIILLNNLRVGPKDEKIIERHFLAWKECKNKALQVPAEIVIQISIHKTIYASTNSSRGIESNKYMRLKIIDANPINTHHQQPAARWMIINASFLWWASAYRNQHRIRRSTKTMNFPHIQCH